MKNFAYTHTHTHTYIYYIETYRTKASTLCVVSKTGHVIYSQTKLLVGKNTQMENVIFTETLC